MLIWQIKSRILRCYIGHGSYRNWREYTGTEPNIMKEPCAPTLTHRTTSTAEHPSGGAWNPFSVGVRRGGTVLASFPGPHCSHTHRTTALLLHHSRSSCYRGPPTVLHGGYVHTHRDEMTSVSLGDFKMWQIRFNTTSSLMNSALL
jgi:hypothetical protein